VVKTDRLEIPHPRFRDREFVLRPLVELEPEWPDPVTGVRARELLAGLESKGSQVKP
jgi:2-amino-4-hydroxy-6-hydroxymethyldihydropteridine diphosphokinase